MSIPIRMNLQHVSKLLKLLGDPTRLMMIKLLESHECCVCEFVAIFNMSQPAISQHLRKLRNIELVTEKRRGQWIFYSINKNHPDYPFIEGILQNVANQDDAIKELEAKGLRISCEEGGQK